MSAACHRSSCPAYDSDDDDDRHDHRTTCLCVRFEPFEYGLLPFPDLIFSDPVPALGSLRRKMHRYSTNLRRNGRINSSGIALCLGMMFDEAQLLLETLAAVSPHTDAISRAPLAEIDAVGADIDDVIMFLYLQNYKRPPFRQHKDVAAVEDVWPLDGSFYSLSILQSRTRRAAPSQADEEAHRLCYIQKHLQALLSLLAEPVNDDCTDSQVVISQGQFNHLGFLIQSRQRRSVVVPLSQDASLFAHSNFNSSSLVPIQKALNWVMKHLCADPNHLQEKCQRSKHGPFLPDDLAMPINILGSPMGCPFGDEFTIIDGVTKGSILKDENNMNAGSVKVTNCHDSAIYVLAPLQYASIYGCSDSIVVLGAVGKAVRMEHCERVQLIVATVRINITSCRECVFYLAVNQSPIILGENHSLQVAPYNTYYPRLERHMKQVGFDSSVNNWDQQVTFGALDPHDSVTHAAGIADAQAEGATVLPPDRFMSFVMPKWTLSNSDRAALTTRNPFLLPKPYVLSQQQRNKAVQMLKEALETLQISEQRKQELAHVIHVHFKDWLLASGNMCRLYEPQTDA